MGRAKILLFEDSAIFADIVLEFLNDEGYETDHAENGIEGIRKLYTFFPDLIISDVEMPLLKGYQASRVLKARASTRPIPLMGTSKNKFSEISCTPVRAMPLFRDKFLEYRHALFVVHKVC